MRIEATKGSRTAWRWVWFSRCEPSMTIGWPSAKGVHGFAMALYALMVWLSSAWAADFQMADAPLTQSVARTHRVAAADKQENTPKRENIENTGPGAENPFAVLWWSDGLNYRVTQRVAMGSTNKAGVPLVNERITLSGRIGIKASFDAASFINTQNQQDVDPDVEVRTLRFYTTGDFTWRRPMYFKVELGVVGRDFYLHEAYLKFKEIPYIKNLTIGYIGAPLTLENMMGFGDLMFMESASPVLAFAPGNRMALQLDGNWLDQRMSYQGGFYGVGQDPSFNFGDASEELARLMFRTTGLPVYEDEAGKFRLLHLGIGLSHVFSDSSQIHYQARPESHLAPFLVDTGDIHAHNASQVGLEAAYVRGPLSLQGELTGSWVENSDLGDRQFWGTYGYASLFLTGEHRPYDKTTGLFGRPGVQEGVEPRSDRWGAWELGVRGSYLDLNDGPVNGGRMFTLMGGLNWYWNSHFRMQLNSGKSIVRDGPSPGNLYIFETRLQLYY